LRFFLFAFLTVLFAGIIPIEARGQALDAIDDAYAIGPGDLLDVRVFGEPEVSSMVTVRIDGRISLPLAGEFMAAGEAPEKLASDIRESLERYIDSPKVTVIVAENRSKSYYILGQVGSPGEYTIRQPVTVIQAIARAGGFLEWANKRRIMVVSGPGTAETIAFFNYNDFLSRPDSKQNIVVQPGDTIVVP